MRVNRQPSKTRERLNHRQTHRDIRHKMAVHHINVQHPCAATLDGLDLFSQTGKVCRKNRGRDVDGSILHFSELPESAINHLVWAAELPDVYSHSLLVVAYSHSADQFDSHCFEELHLRWYRRLRSTGSRLLVYLCC